MPRLRPDRAATGAGPCNHGPFGIDKKGRARHGPQDQPAKLRLIVSVARDVWGD